MGLFGCCLIAFTCGGIVLICCCLLWMICWFSLLGLVIYGCLVGYFLLFECWFIRLLCYVV